MKKTTEEYYLKMLEILPPKVWYKTVKGEVFQVGEPYDANDKGFRFQTFEKINGSYYDRGVENLHKPEKNKIIMSD